jgi:hypothetical protein
MRQDINAAMNMKPEEKINHERKARMFDRLFKPKTKSRRCENLSMLRRSA